MKHLVPIIFTFSVTTSFGQNYNKAIKDSSISNFMNWLFQSDSAFKALRHVNNKILKWYPSDVEYLDSTKASSYQFSQNIFANKTGLKQLLSKQDADFFLRQVKTQRRQKWNLRQPIIKLFDTVKLVNNHLDTALFSYSLPLFSTDRNYVVIIQAFYCGLVCGGGSYYLYQRDASKAWKKLKSFNEWEE